MDLLSFFVKLQSSGGFSNLFNTNSHFTSVATDRNIETQSSIFVVSEQVLDTSGKANIQHAATKITNMDDWVSMFRPFSSCIGTFLYRKFCSANTIHNKNCVLGAAENERFCDNKNSAAIISY